MDISFQQYSQKINDMDKLVEKIKEDMLSINTDGMNPYEFIATSAYDTAWLAMVDHDYENNNGHQGGKETTTKEARRRPMFEKCLEWVLNSQREGGYWGEIDGHGFPTVECLPSTIACMVALKKWNVGELLIIKGMKFIEENATNLIGEVSESNCRWLAIVLPGMIELARSHGLHVIFPNTLKDMILDIFFQRQEILGREELLEKDKYAPLISYFEALPNSHFSSTEKKEIIERHIGEDGSLYQSPSATACAFIISRNKSLLAYLQSLVQTCPNGVPSTFPINDDLVRLCIVNQLDKLGLVQYFNQEIQGVLEQVYRNYKNNEEEYCGRKINPSNIAPKLYKDSMAFWLLRVHGYDVSPGKFCWFMSKKEIKEYIDSSAVEFSSVMLNVYKATNLMFPGEYQIEEVKIFSRNILLKTIDGSPEDQRGQASPIIPIVNDMIKHELRCPWITRMDHLDDRMWIEDKNVNSLWMGKSTFFRLSSLYNDKLMQLALQAFTLRQSTYKNELEELKRWSNKWGLSEMGFGREKTTYCYFSVAASTSLPLDSHVRMIVAKGAIIITVADDFYDMHASFHDCEILTNAIQGWDSSGLIGHSRTIFDALDNLVNEIVTKCSNQHGADIIHNLRQLWYETFASWHNESKWREHGHIPTIEEYLENGKISIAAHTLILSASLLLKPFSYNVIANNNNNNKLISTNYHTITQMVMLIPRLLNDTQSYEKEIEEGKTNYVLLYMKENPKADIEESITHVKEILKKKKQEFLENTLTNNLNNLPKPFKELHLSCLKVFHMFFDISNRYDSQTEMIHDIQNAIYVPIQIKKPAHKKQEQEVAPLVLPFKYNGPSIRRSNQTVRTTKASNIDQRKRLGFRVPARYFNPKTTEGGGSSLKMSMSMQFMKLCFI